MIFKLKIIDQILITFLTVSYFSTAYRSVCEAQESSEWECTNQNCEAPNKPRERAKNYEVAQDRKFELKKKKLLAKDEKKFDRLGRQNKNVLGLDKKKKGHFGVWSFPNNGN